MARMLCNTGGFFKKIWEQLMSAKKCLILICARNAGCQHRGLCLKCYGDAKKEVEAGRTTWEKLEQLGLCEKKDSTASPFNDAYSKAMEGQ